MASTDFGTREYSYVDQKDDFELKTFALQEEDLKFKVRSLNKETKIR